jgi:hypothetical protein
MPYTPEERRELQYEPIRLLSRFIQDKGDLNHAICELTAMLMLRTGGMGYTNVSEWLDAVGGAHDEMRRRLLDPYEDVKIEENGDVRSFVKLLNQLPQLEEYDGFRKDKK